MQSIKLTSEMSIELERLAFMSASSIDFFAAELIVLNKSFKIKSNQAIRNQIIRCGFIYKETQIGQCNRSPQKAEKSIAQIAPAACSLHNPAIIE